MPLHCRLHSIECNSMRRSGMLCIRAGSLRCERVHAAVRSAWLKVQPRQCRGGLSSQNRYGHRCMHKWTALFDQRAKPPRMSMINPNSQRNIAVHNRSIQVPSLASSSVMFWHRTQSPTCETLVLRDSVWQERTCS